VVYKPKDLGIDEVFWGFIAWLNTRAPMTGFCVSER
jgi:lantibiotic modifying enzyme